MLSGIELNINGPATGTVTGTFSQTFRLPSDYQRGFRIPEIQGVALCQQITDPEAVSIDVVLETNQDGVWSALGSATATGADAVGDFIWTEVFFEDIPIDEILLDNQFRITVTTENPTWYSLPNSLPLETGPSLESGSEGTLRFRLLTNTADTGQDFFGNRYRSIVSRNSPDLIDTNGNNYWLSKPNPSKFAVESLYFDIGSSAFDRILVDPITPGVLFHLYTSDEGEPGTNDDEWESKLWTPIAQTYTATRREEHALPQPVAARYVKVEFCHLQAQHYSPGIFHQPTVYKKHPKWVLDYFLARISSMTEDPFIARRIAVVYDAYDLAFNYYLDDLHQNPLHPEELRDSGAISSFFSDRQDVSDQVDSDTFDRIKASLAPYRQAPGLLAKGLDYLPSLYTQTGDTNYPIERIVSQVANTSQVSTLDRTALVIEQNFPGTFFYLQCRHKYRELSASFEEDRAYFVGIRQLAFTRDHYAVPADNELYVETLADHTNVQRNDFLPDDYPPRKLGTSRI